MPEARVPRDRSLRAYRLARELGQGSLLTSSDIAERITSDAIDLATAREAAEAVVRERMDRSEAWRSSVRWAVLFSISISSAALFARRLQFLLLLAIVIPFLLFSYPWGWRLDARRNVEGPGAPPR